jgi:hypothetical protein
MSVLSYSGLLIELDCLLDTRLATIHSFGKEYTETALRNNYFGRDTDVFPGITREQFAERYMNRGKAILQHAMPTPMLNLCREFVRDTLGLVHNTPFHLKPLIIINIYPYKLSEPEINNIIKGMVSHTRETADVSVVSYSDKQITPDYVKSDIAIMIKYQYLDWLETHALSKAFLKKTCPESGLIGPVLYFIDPPPDSNEQIQRPKGGSFDILEEATAPIIGLKLLPISEFSVLLPKSVQSLKNSW